MSVILYLRVRIDNPMPVRGAIFELTAAYRVYARIVELSDSIDL
ncbi:MAG TPA: hypothetical protein VGG45_10195 [Terracidiphilus sp.]|jgi:hypothetical protein